MGLGRRVDGHIDMGAMGDAVNRKTNLVLIEIVADIDGETIRKCYEVGGTEGSMKSFRKKGMDHFREKFPDGEIISVRSELLEGRPDPFQNCLTPFVLVSAILMVLLLSGCAPKAQAAVQPAPMQLAPMHVPAETIPDG